MRQFVTAFLLSFFLLSPVMAGGDDTDKGPVESLDALQQAPVSSEKIATPAPTESESLVVVPKETMVEAEETMSEPEATMSMSEEPTEKMAEEKVYTTPEALKDTLLEPVYETCEDLAESNSFMKYACVTILSVFAIL